LLALATLSRTRDGRDPGVRHGRDGLGDHADSHQPVDALRTAGGDQGAALGSSSFNAGIAGGPWIAGIALNSSLGRTGPRAVGAAPAGGALELDRRRLLEMEHRLLRPRLISYLCVMMTLVAVARQSTPWIFVLPFVPLLNYKLATKRLGKTARPEYAIAYAASVTQLMVAVGVAMSGGPQSPVMALLVIPFVSFAARFTARGPMAGVVLTALLLGGATVGLDPSRLLGLACPVNTWMERSSHPRRMSATVTEHEEGLPADQASVLY